MTKKQITVAKINFIIDELLFSSDYAHNMTAMKYIALKKRVQNNQKLTTKMKQDLSWVEKEVKAIGK